MVAETCFPRNISKFFLQVFYTTLVLHLLLLPVCIGSAVSSSLEIDVCGDIYGVVDGDTLDVFPIGRVRLADVNAPELGTSEGELAKQALLSLIKTHSSRAYLDVDDLYVMDKYNRLVVVAYLRYNETHLLNVNKWLVENNYASIYDYPNEFNPYTWTLYVYSPGDPCMEKTMATTITATTTVTVTIARTQPVAMLILISAILVAIVIAVFTMIVITRRRR